MYGFFYNIGVSLAFGLISLFKFTSPRISTFFKQRSEGQNLPSRPIKYWIHCASLGEFEMAVPLLIALEKRCNKDQILITFFSPSGYQQAIKSPWKESVCYLPIDTKRKVKKFYDKFQAETAILIRYELWFNLINEGLKRGVKFQLVNGRFNENHLLFSSKGRPYKKLVHQFENVFCSDAKSAELLKINGLLNAQFTGDTRYERVLQIKEKEIDLRAIKTFKGSHKLMVVGSSWQEEEKWVEYLLSRSIDMKFLIAPHDVSNSRIDEIKQRFSAYSPAVFSKSFSKDDSILILDTVGMLSSIYQLADFAFVGGGFTGALHNILEPAVWGNHISFGPKIEKFPEASQFIDAGFGHAIVNKEAWFQEVISLLEKPMELERVHQKSADFVLKNKGAGQKIIAAI